MYKATPSSNYGVWNALKKEFQFGIHCETPEQAAKALRSKIGYDSARSRFQIRKKTSELCRIHNQTQIERIQEMIKCKNQEIRRLIADIKEYRVEEKE